MPMIPIRNIYYMLFYAWGTLKESKYAKLSTEDFENIYELLTSILAKELNLLLKRGLTRDYIHETNELTTLRGKIDISESIKMQTSIRGRMICQYDEFSYNTYMNQIIKSTINKLIKCNLLKEPYKKELLKINGFFNDIGIIPITKIDWKGLKYHRNNINYRIIMDICYLICEGLIVNEQNGNVKFSTFIKDKQMATLYEKFVLGFYKKEYPELKPNSKYIDWDLDEIPPISFLPTMHTDITLECKGKQLIIDTKYYPEAMQKSPHNENKTLISGNLYQIFAYVKNSDFVGEIKGMLLYPTVGYELDENYKMSGNEIYIKTLDLNKDFIQIKEQLIKIREIVFN